MNDREFREAFYRIQWRLEMLLKFTWALRNRMEDVMALLDPILEKVAKLETAEESILALVTELAKLLRDNAGDPAAVQAIADRLDADAQRIIDKVNENTPPPPA